MPEGPSIVLLKEAMQPFAGKKIISVNGNSKIDQGRLINEKVISFQSWGKHLLICLKDFTIRVHLLMFGSCRINEKKEQVPRLSILFKDGEINFYACSVKLLEGNVNTHYDFTTDVMNDQWDPKNAEIKLKQVGSKLICDMLLEQPIFSGVGNIIKNEVLYRVRVHPESIVKKLPALKIKEIIKAARNYSFEFLEWKRNYVLKKHWLAHTKTICLQCDSPILKKYTGVKNRRSFFCTQCQPLYI